MKLRRVSRRAEVRELRDRVARLSVEKAAARRQATQWQQAAICYDEEATRLKAEIVDLRTFLAVLGSRWQHPSGCG